MVINTITILNVKEMRNILKIIDPVSVTYTDAGLRNLVEEYITQQKSEFTLKGVCSYILFWAVEDGKVVEGKKLIESDELHQSDQERVKRILDAVVADGRIATTSGSSYIKL